MIYRPSSDDICLWDTWMIHHEGQYHLFYLRKRRDKAWDSVGHVVTADFATWKECDPLELKSDNGSWDDGLILTGSVIHTGNEFAMTYACERDKVQRIGILFSKDLHHWVKFDRNPILECESNEYEVVPGSCVHWRDALLLQRTDGFEALICARLARGSPAQRGCIVVARSPDLRNWKVTGRIASPDVYPNMEVPDSFSLGHKHYLLFSTTSHFGKPLPASGRRNLTGTFYLVSDAHEGPYTTPEDNFVVGCGNNRFNTYVGRTLPYPSGRLLYHHIDSQKGAGFGIPKLLQQQADGSLSVSFLPEMRVLKKRLHEDGFSRDLRTIIYEFYAADDRESWIRRGPVLEGKCGYGSSAAFSRSSVANHFFECKLSLEHGESVGLVCRYDFERKIGFSVVIDAAEQSASVGRVAAGYLGLNYHEFDSCRMAVTQGHWYAVTMIALDEFFEVYIDGRWCFTLSEPDLPKEGHCGVWVQTARAAFRQMEIYDA
jgi:sucrose-6-phosphate hydrolase SacC (GH32 family)